MKALLIQACRVVALILVILLSLLLVVEGKSPVFAFCFEKAGSEYQVNPDLLRAIAIVESNLNPEAINYNKNGSYDYGLMQINSTTWQKTLDYRWDYILDPCYNLMVGSWILRQCLDRYRNIRDAISCYHTGKALRELQGKRREEAFRYVREVWKKLRKEEQCRK